MSMTQCRECGTQVSTSAKSCPHCGAAGKAFRGRAEKKQVSRKGKIGIAAVVASAVALSSPLIMGSTASQPKSPEQLADSARMHAAYLAVNSLRRALREPESAVFEKVRVDEEAEAVCIIYRARNGFGGMSREHVVFIDGDPSQRSSSWKQHCAHKSLYDLDRIVRL